MAQISIRRSDGNHTERDLSIAVVDVSIPPAIAINGSGLPEVHEAKKLGFELCVSLIFDDGEEPSIVIDRVKYPVKVYPETGQRRLDILLTHSAPQRISTDGTTVVIGCNQNQLE